VSHLLDSLPRPVYWWRRSSRRLVQFTGEQEALVTSSSLLVNKKLVCQHLLQAAAAMARSSSSNGTPTALDVFFERLASSNYDLLALQGAVITRRPAQDAYASLVLFSLLLHG
jgi:hypothetical protein